ncbi:hypothetical protein GA0115240_15313 [Streptomyces sp. DvalAA-14]|uniref:hypothetical protein n=1 Tax=unclassified Streptomyces TaxID=2593676 RepID=UPI00081B96DA|nr:MULTISPECIES: hypothetical protein [unclassified Streptomyces]MYS23498.1 hypothetical protein [Streptomyces sp. SID4948]SCE34263.1 hypothetical protein GA0115240_15313 [Streptomyces sp. DvalAA-14]
MNRIRLAALGAAALLAAGCSAPAAHAPTAHDHTSAQAHAPAPAAEAAALPSVASVPRLTTATDRALPIAPYLLTDSQADQLAAAQAVLTDRCMARFGFHYRTPAPAKGFRPKTPTQYRYGVTDPLAAKADGYAPPGSRIPPPAVKRPPLPAPMTLVLTGTNDSHVKPGSPQATGGEAYHGQRVPVGGCLGEARSRLLSAGPAAGGDASLADTINVDSFEDSRRDPRVKAVFAGWSACMKARGYTYPDPLTAASDPAWDTKAPSAREEAVAAADADCKQRGNVIGVWYAVDSAYQRQAIGQHSKALAAVRTDITARLRLAAAALTG